MKKTSMALILGIFAIGCGETPAPKAPSGPPAGVTGMSHGGGGGAPAMRAEHGAVPAKAESETKPEGEKPAGDAPAADAPK